MIDRTAAATTTNPLLQTAVEEPWRPVGLWNLFLLFFRAGLIFGGGITIMAVLQKELVEQRKAVTRGEFLTLYALGRIVPSGTMTALAVAYGFKFGGLPGTVVALGGLALPALVPIMALTIVYGAVQGSPWLDLLPVTLLPAAVALVGGAVFTLGKEVARPSLDLVVAAAALFAALVLRVNPAVLLVAGGAFGALLIRGETT